LPVWAVAEQLPIDPRALSSASSDSIARMNPAAP